jgi:hypothetical protein
MLNAVMLIFLLNIVILSSDILTSVILNSFIMNNVTVICHSVNLCSVICVPLF